MNESNVTELRNIQNANMENSGVMFYLLSYTLIFVGFIIISMELVAVFVLLKCRRIPLCSRVLSTSFVISDAAAACIFASFQIAIAVFGNKDDVTLHSRVLSIGAIKTVSWASIASLSLERVVALKLNIKYNLNSSKSKIYVLVSLIWIVNIFIVSVATVTGFYYHCYSEHAICDVWEASKAGRFCMMSMLVLYEIIIVISYVIIHGIAARHMRDMNATKMACKQMHSNPESLTSRQYAATIAIIKIVFAFIILHSPLVVQIFLFEYHANIENQLFRNVLYGISYSCIQINSFISVRLYVAKIDECRLKFYLILSRISKKYDKEAEKLRVKVYDIAVSSKMRKRVDVTDQDDHNPDSKDSSTFRF